jgi:hypothetical protein
MGPVEDSIVRRLRFATASRAAIDRTMRRPQGKGVPVPLRQASQIAADLLYDSGEWLRSGFRLKRPGQIHLAALEAPGRLPQHAASRGYWYDPERHACVGMHLGLDLARHDDKYHVIEANLGAALRQSRRKLYSEKLDPIIASLLKVAETHKFKRIVLLRDGWLPSYREEFALAQKESGIEVIGTRSPFIPQATSSGPGGLLEDTLYVAFAGQGTPLSLYIHDKLWSGRWLQDAIDRDPAIAERLAYTPTFPQIVLPEGPQDPRWPNLVIKLASGDSGLFVVLGRFRSEAHVCDELRMQTPADIPGVFNLGLKDRLIDRLFPRLQTIFQPYITPDLVDGKIRKVRLHAFVSPLADQFLSAHDVIGHTDVPEICPEGLVADPAPYMSSFSSAASTYAKGDPAEEPDLAQACREYGHIARVAIAEKFEIGPRIRDRT